MPDEYADLIRGVVGSKPKGYDSETALDLISQHESGGRNIKQQIVPAGGGYNPSVGRVTGPSTAGGPWQITNSTWRKRAPQEITQQYPTAMSAPVEVQRDVARKMYQETGFQDWAPYNASLRKAISRGQQPSQQPRTRTVSTPDDEYSKLIRETVGTPTSQAQPQVSPPKPQGWGKGTIGQGVKTAPVSADQTTGRMAGANVTGIARTRATNLKNRFGPAGDVFGAAPPDPEVEAAQKSKAQAEYDRMVTTNAGEVARVKEETRRQIQSQGGWTPNVDKWLAETVSRGESHFNELLAGGARPLNTRAYNSLWSRAEGIRQAVEEESRGRSQASKYAQGTLAGLASPEMAAAMLHVPPEVAFGGGAGLSSLGRGETPAQAAQATRIGATEGALFRAPAVGANVATRTLSKAGTVGAGTYALTGDPAAAASNAVFAATGPLLHGEGRVPRMRGELSTKTEAQPNITAQPELIAPGVARTPELVRQALIEAGYEGTPEQVRMGTEGHLLPDAVEAILAKGKSNQNQVPDVATKTPQEVQVENNALRKPAIAEPQTPPPTEAVGTESPATATRPVEGETVAKEPWEMTDKELDAKYPLASNTVDGRTVGTKVANLDSIEASVTDPLTLSGIREVPMSEFDLTGESYSPSEEKRIDNLAEQIKASGHIDPLIVVIDPAGAYILEGSHRVDALYKLGAKSFPAKVVIDAEGHYDAVESALKEGRSVRPEILAEYPDLAAKYGKSKPSTPPTVAAPKPEGGAAVAAASSPEMKPSRLAQGVEAKAVEAKLTEGFQDLPEYKTVNVKDQAQRATELLDSNPEQARKIAMGDAAPEGDLTPEAVFTAVENRALAKGDTQMLLDLARGTRSVEASSMGQRIRMLRERNPNSPVAAIEKVEQARTARIPKKKIQKVENQIKTEVEVEIRKGYPKGKEWSTFLDSIMCR